MGRAFAPRREEEEDPPSAGGHSSGRELADTQVHKKVWVGDCNMAELCVVYG